MADDVVGAVVVAVAAVVDADDVVAVVEQRFAVPANAYFVAVVVARPASTRNDAAVFGDDVVNLKSDFQYSEDFQIMPDCEQWIQGYHTEIHRYDVPSGRLPDADEEVFDRAGCRLSGPTPSSAYLLPPFVRTVCWIFTVLLREEKYAEMDALAYSRRSLLC